MFGVGLIGEKQSMRLNFWSSELIPAGRSPDEWTQGCSWSLMFVLWVWFRMLVHLLHGTVQPLLCRRSHDKRRRTWPLLSLLVAKDHTLERCWKPTWIELKTGEDVRWFQFQIIFPVWSVTLSYNFTSFYIKSPSKIRRGKHTIICVWIVKTLKYGCNKLYESVSW